jgi:hypothetical protein
MDKKTKENKNLKEVQCPLCGLRFNPEKVEKCKACPKFFGCKLLMCPNCYHEFPKP